MINASRTILYSMARLSAELQARYALRGRLAATRAAVYALSQGVRKDVDVSYALSAATPVSNARTAVYGMLAPAAEFVEPISASVDGRELHVTELDMRCDEDSCCISCTFIVAAAAEWSRCLPKKTLAVQVGDVEIVLLVDERSQSRSFGKTSYSVYGRSAAMLLDSPYAPPVTRSWTGTTALAIARELCDAYGVALDWRMADWPLALYSADSLTPLEILSELMSESGVLFSTPAGVLVAQYLYPVSPTRYADVAAELELSDIDDVLTLKGSYESSPGYNTVSVLIDQDEDEPEVDLVVWDGGEDGVEAADSNTQRIVALFPSRLEGLESSNGDVVVHDQGVRTFEKEETVAIVGGEGELSYPPDSLSEYTYRSRDLGSIDISGKTVNTSETGHSALYVRYRTSYRCYLVECLTGTQALVTVEPESLSQDGAPQLIQVVRSPADKSCPEIIEDEMCTNALSARERGRNYLDEYGFDKEWYELETPVRALPLPGAVVSVLDASRGATFRAKLTGWTVEASLDGAMLCSRVTYDLERSLIENTRSAL